MKIHKNNNNNKIKMPKKNTHISKLNNNNIPKILCLTKMDTERKKERKAFLKVFLENSFFKYIW